MRNGEVVGSEVDGGVVNFVVVGVGRVVVTGVVMGAAVTTGATVVAATVSESPLSVIVAMVPRIMLKAMSAPTPIPPHLSILSVVRIVFLSD